MVAQRSSKNPFEKSYLIPFLFSHDLICRIIGFIGWIKNIHVYIVLVVYSIKELMRWERHPKFISSCPLLLPVQITANLKMNAFNEILTCKLCQVLLCYIYLVFFHIAFITFIPQPQYSTKIIRISLLDCQQLVVVQKYLWLQWCIISVTLIYQ